MDNPGKLAKLGAQDEHKQQQNNNTLCVGHHYTQTNTNNVSKIWALLQTTGGKDELNIVFEKIFIQYISMFIGIISFVSQNNN